MATYIREDQADIRLWVNGKMYGDLWKTAEGGALEADVGKTRPGGMGFEAAVGAPASRDDVTLTTQFTDVIAGSHNELESLIGSGRAAVGIAWLNNDRTPNGRGRTLQGILKKAASPDHGDGADVGMYTVIVTLDELAA